MVIIIIILFFLANQNTNTNLFGQQATKPANVLQFLSGSKPTHAAFPVGEGVWHWIRKIKNAKIKKRIENEISIFAQELILFFEKN